MDHSVTTELSSDESLTRHLGRQVRARRLALGLTQEKLGKMLGLTFQQIQKYEQGVCRISASRLFDLSRALRMPITYFYESYLPTRDPAGVGPEGQVGEPEVPELGFFLNGESQEFMRLYGRIQNIQMRKSICDLTRVYLDVESESLLPSLH